METPMRARHTVPAEQVIKHGGDVYAALSEHITAQLKSLTDFQMSLYIMARKAWTHPEAFDFAVDGPFKEVTK